MSQFIYRNRRRDQRRRQPTLVVKLGSIEGFTSLDWSLGGVAASGPVFGFQIGDKVKGGLGMKDSEDDLLEFSGVVTRASREEGVVAVKFTDLSPQCFALLERLSVHPLQGMSSAGGRASTAGRATAKARRLKRGFL